MSAKAVVATIGVKIKHDLMLDTYRNYTARCLRILTENTAVAAGCYSGGEVGSYLTMEFEDIVSPKPQKEYKKGEIADKIRTKMR